MKRFVPAILLPAIVLSIASCAARPPAPAPAPGGRDSSRKVLEAREGLASYYGKRFHGRLTASGVPFDMNALVAAHPTYPFGTVVRVTNLRNRRFVEVRVVDRGPAAGPRADGVIIDVSQGAAEALGFIRAGRVRVRLQVLRWGN